VYSEIQNSRWSVNSIVSDGRKRLEESDERRARIQALKLEIEARYAGRLKGSSILERIVLCVHIRLEFRRECAKLEPSHAALFIGYQKS
jgi:hypothetical protein